MEVLKTFDCISHRREHLKDLFIQGGGGGGVCAWRLFVLVH